MIYDPKTPLTSIQGGARPTDGVAQTPEQVGNQGRDYHSEASEMVGLSVNFSTWPASIG